LNIVASADTNGLRGWDRTNFSTASNLWAYSAGGNMQGLASKSTTTWFLGGRHSAAQFIKSHFEIANTAQLTYIADNWYNHGSTWYLNTVYIMQASNGGTSFRTFLDTSITLIE
jgi:hypothetical protein